MEFSVDENNYATRKLNFSEQFILTFDHSQYKMVYERLVIKWLGRLVITIAVRGVAIWSRSSVSANWWQVFGFGWLWRRSGDWRWWWSSRFEINSLVLPTMIVVFLQQTLEVGVEVVVGLELSNQGYWLRLYNSIGLDRRYHNNLRYLHLKFHHVSIIL